MSDKQPLLSPTSQVSGDNDDDSRNTKQLAADTFSDWRQCLRGQKSVDGSYEKLDNDEEDKAADMDNPVPILKMFRYADGLDYVLMCLGFVFLTGFVICILANLFLLGRVTGLFATQSFTVTCEEERVNITLPIRNNSGCPLGIELNSINYDRLSKLCGQDVTTPMSTLAPFSSHFREDVMHIVRLLFLVSICAFLSGWSLNITWSMSIKRQTTRMSMLLFRSLIQRNVAYLDMNTASQFNAKLFANIEKIDKGIGFEFLVLVAIIFLMIISIISAFFVNWKLSLILFCINPFIVFGSLVFSKLMSNETINELNTYSKAGHIVQEVFSSVRTVLSLNGSDFEQKRYEKELHPTQRSGIRKGALFGIFIGWLSFVSYIVYAVGFVFGAILMSYGGADAITISDIVIVVSISAQTVSYLSMIGPFFQTVSEGQGAAGPVFRLIDEEQNPRVNEADLLTKNIATDESRLNIIGDVEFDNVNFMYPSREDAPVLRNLNLVARANQTTALVGSSGCGKSTSIALLLRYYEPSSGRITINGRPISDLGLKEYRRNIGVVSQEPILFGMSIYENIRLGKLNATRAEIEEAAQQANAHNFIMQLPNKYETLVGERGVQLSGGEKQRVALARALVKQPTILLLDEATSALDNVSEKIVQEALDRACKDRTTIIIAHRLTTIQHADHIYVLDKGGVVEEGTHETLMTKEDGRYQRLVKSQNLETVTDDNGDLIDRARITAVDYEEQMSERSRLLSEGELVDLNKKDVTPSNERSPFTRLLLMNKPEWINIAIGCSASSLNALGQPVFAALLATIISAFKDCGHSNEFHHRVFTASLLFILLGFLLWFTRFLEYTAFGISGSKLTHRIRSKTFKCLLRQEVAYFDRPENNSGAICARLSSDATAVQELAGARLGVICEGFALSLFGLLFGLIFSYQLTLIVIGFILLLGCISFLHVGSSKRLKQQLDLITEQASTLSVEVMQNIRTVKQLSIEDEAFRIYSQYMSKVITVFWQPGVVNAAMFGFYWAMDSLVLACLYWRGLDLLEKGDLRFDNIIMVFSFATFTTQSLRIVGMLSDRIGSSMTAADSFFQLFDRTSSIDNISTTGQELVDFRGEIEIDEVKFSYPSRPSTRVLNRLHLNVKSGQRVALVGTSGCGKSTIIQLLERFYDATHGRLLLDGVDIRQLNLQWVRSRLGLVSQEPILFDLTIAENITYGLENVPMSEIIDAARKANIHEFIQQLPQGYETRVGNKGSFLSGGEKQRIAIARVLLRRPKILLLDEATSAMDSNNEQIVQQALDQAQTEDPTRTSIIIAHRLSTIRSCDLICVLDKGRIVESGTHAELVQQRGIYHHLLTQNNV